MKSLRHIFLCSIFFFNNAPIASEVDNSYQKQSLLAVLYKRTSAEYKANTFQVYSSAKNNIDKALQDKSWTALLNQDKDYQNLPPAVILDIDETVLDNSEHQVRSIKNGTNYPVGWKEWVSEETAGALPGVKEYLTYADTKGVKIFYVTNRTHDLEEYTRNNLKSLGLPLDNDMDVLMMKNENGWTSDKTSRRDLIKKNFRVIHIFGDQLDDFIPLQKTATNITSRKTLIDQHSDMWGEKWYMLVNPMYGEWEEALYEHCWSCFPEESDRVIQRLKALD